jgi:hypothetical protein
MEWTMIIQRPEPKIIRFGLGNSKRLESALWRLWVQGNETYLATRTSVGISKISLHNTGHWMLTADTASLPVKGPSVLGSGVRGGPRLAFPGVPPKVRLRGVDDVTTKRVFLFDPPAVGTWRDFTIVFTAPGAAIGGIAEVFPRGANAVGPLRLRNGDNVWLVTFTVMMTGDDIALVHRERAKFQITLKRDILAVPEASAVLLFDVADDVSMLLCLELGRENLRVG